MEISRLRKKGKSFSARLANADDLSRNTAFQEIVRKMAKPARLFSANAAAGIKEGKRATLYN